MNAEIDHDLTKEVANLNSRIDDIVAFQKRKAPWYRDTAIMISAAAFLASIATSCLSAYHTYHQDINSRRDSLESLIRQFYAMALENISSQHAIRKEVYEIQKDIDAQHKPENTNTTAAGAKDGLEPALATASPSSLAATAALVAIEDANAASSAINGPVSAINTALAKKALSMVDELNGYWWDNAVSIDESEVGYILSTVYQYNTSEVTYKKAVASARNSSDYLAAIRGLAGVQYQMGKAAEAADNMKKALDVFVNFDREPATEDYKNWNQLVTYIYWIGFIGSSDCKLAREILNEANRYANLLTPSIALNTGGPAQIEMARQRLQMNCPDWSGRMLAATRDRA